MWTPSLVLAEGKINFLKQESDGCNLKMNIQIKSKIVIQMYVHDYKIVYDFYKYYSCKDDEHLPSAK